MYRADSRIEPVQLLGCWHHIAGIWGAFGVEIWIDGQQRGTANYFGRPAHTWQFTFGCSLDGYCMNGKLDEVPCEQCPPNFFGANIGARHQSDSDPPIAARR